ncbi:unnamed protein product [Arctogadus glacialis]
MLGRCGSKEPHDAIFKPHNKLQLNTGGNAAKRTTLDSRGLWSGNEACYDADDLVIGHNNRRQQQGDEPASM